MLAIWKRDLRAYFMSPTGYVFCAFFLLIFNLFFYFILTGAQTSDLTGVFSSMLLFTILFVPIVTMRLLSEEYKQKTDQLLLCSPVRLTSIVTGKFLAAVSMFTIATAFTLVYLLIILVCGGNILVASTVGNYVAFILMASAFIAMGLFFSSLTENQIVAALISWGVFLLFYILYLVLGIPQFAMSFVWPWPLDFLNSVFTPKDIFEWISPFARFDNFTRGIFSLADVVFYLSICGIFLFLTVRVLDKKRWS